MRVGLGELSACVEVAYDGSCLVDDSIVSGSTTCGNDPSCLMTGVPLAKNPFTGQPSSSFSQFENVLSNNSQLIVAGAAIIGLVVALGKGRR